MSIQPVSNQAAAQQPAPVQQPKAENVKADTAPVAQKPAAPQAQPKKDTVQVSNLSQQALQEATETKAQSVKEAQGGDIQAKKLVAREDAIKAAQQPPANPASDSIDKLLK